MIGRLIAKRNLPFLAILGLAALFRFAYFDLIRYDLDNAFPTAQAIRILEGRELPLLSLRSSVVIPNPPLMSYLQAIPLALVRSPFASLFGVTALNLMVVPIVYWIGRRHFGERVALVAALLAAASPWTVFFSRLTWVQGLVPFFAALTAMFLSLGIETEDRGRGRWLLLGLITASLGAQTFVLAYALFATVAILIVAFHASLPRKATVVGSLSAILLCLPFAVAFLGDSEAREGASAVLQGAEWEVDGEAFEHAMRLIDGFEFSLARTAEFEADLEVRSRLERWVHVVSVGLFAVGTFRLLLAVPRREPGWKPGVMVLVWFFTPVALMIVHPFPVHPHYLLLTIPAGYLILGRGIGSLLHSRLLKGPVIVGAVIFVAVSGINLLRFFQLMEMQPNIGRLAWLPLRYSAPMGGTIGILAERWNVTEVYADLDESVLTALTGKPLPSYQAFDPAELVVIPEGRPALYVLLPGEVSPAFAFAHQEPSFPVGGGRGVDFYVFPARSRAELARLPTHPLDVAFDNGFRLLGYDLPGTATVGDLLPVTTYWFVESLYDERFLHYYGPFYHVVNPEGLRFAVGGGEGLAGYLWRRGDLYVSAGGVAVPADLAPGSYLINTGLYDPNADRRALIVDREGAPYGDVVPLGPLVIEAS